MKLIRVSYLLASFVHWRRMANALAYYLNSRFAYDPVAVAFNLGLDTNPRESFRWGWGLNLPYYVSLIEGYALDGDLETHRNIPVQFHFKYDKEK